MVASSIIYAAEKSVVMFHNWKPAHRAHNITLDLGSHLLSVVAASKPAHNNIRLLHWDENCVMIDWDGILGIGMYSPIRWTHSLFGKSPEKWLEHGIDTLIDGQPLPWEANLFGIQIDNILKGKPGVYRDVRSYYSSIDRNLMDFLITPVINFETKRAVLKSVE